MLSVCLLTVVIGDTKMWKKTPPALRW